MPNVRPLSPIDSLVELTDLLHRAYARLGSMGLNFTAVDQTPDVTAKRIARGQCFVAESEGTIVGTIVVHPTYTENECEYFSRTGVAAVHQFGVEPATQGRGVGRALLQACESWARQRGYAEVAMDTAQPATHLINFYERLGYKHVGHVQWSGKVYRSVVLSKPLQ
jgi:GNAT superfamily N-acetyltransferase